MPYSSAPIRSPQKSEHETQSTHVPLATSFETREAVPAHSASPSHDAPGAGAISRGCPSDDAFDEDAISRWEGEGGFCQ